MAAPLRIRRRISGAPGAPGSLLNAELAFNEVDETLYYGKGTGGGGGTASVILAVGGPGAFLNLSQAQTVTGVKTFTASPTVPLLAGGDNSGKAVSSQWVKNQGYGQGTVTSVGLSLPGIFNVSGSPVSSTGTLTATLADQLQNQVFCGPSAGTAAPTFRSLAPNDIPSLDHTKISDFDAGVRSNRLDQMAAPTSAVDLNSQKLTGLGTPTASDDAATKGYVDAASAGLDVKESCRVATTAEIALSGLQTIDGVFLSSGDRVLVKDQSTSRNNGIYEVSVGAWSRTDDADADAEVTSGMFTFIEEGTTQADTGWVLSTDGTITVGSTNLSFVQFSGAGQIDAGDGLTRSGNTLDVVGGAGISVSTNSVALTSGVATPGTFRSVTVDTYGRVTAGTNPTTLAGYGITDAQALNATLTGIAALQPVASGRLLYTTGSDAFAEAPLTAFARSLLDDGNASTARGTLGLGTMATQDADAVAITGGTIDGVELDGGTF